MGFEVLYCGFITFDNVLYWNFYKKLFYLTQTKGRCQLRLSALQCNALKMGAFYTCVWLFLVFARPPLALGRNSVTMVWSVDKAGNLDICYICVSFLNQPLDIAYKLLVTLCCVLFTRPFQILHLASSIPRNQQLSYLCFHNSKIVFLYTQSVNKTIYTESILDYS